MPSRSSRCGCTPPYGAASAILRRISSDRRPSRDEKIGGTVHLALGRSYPETGGANESALHRDLMGDLRRGGRITADGEAIQVDGAFVGR